MCTLNVTVSLITHVINTVNEVGVQYTHNTTLPRSPCAKLGLLERNNHRCKKKKKTSVFRQTTNKQFSRENKMLKHFFLAKINKNVQLSVEGSSQWQKRFYCNNQPIAVVVLRRRHRVENCC